MHLTSAVVAIAARCRAFGRERRGNVSLLFGFSLVPMIGLAGLGVDYGIAYSAKTKLDNAADAAALAAVATAKAYVAAHATDSNVNNGAIAAGLDRAKRAFAVNAGTVSFTTVPTPTINLTRTGQTFASTASYSTTSTTQFGQLFGKSALTLSGAAAASADVPSYLDFYIMVDESGSMGIPTSSSDQTALAAVNGTCQFACHFPASAGGGDGYSIATTGKTNNGTKVLNAPVQLRSGAVNNALCKLLTRAAAPAVTNQYRVGIYPFINQLATMSSLTTDIASLKTAADCTSTPPMKLTSLLDTDATQFYTGSDATTGVGSGGTHFESVLPGMKSVVSPVGDGSNASTSKPFVFLITDGMDNNQHFGSWSGSAWRYVGNPNTAFKSYTGSDGKTPITSNWDGSQPQLFSTSLCSQLNSGGITLSILYIPYVPLTLGTSNQGETLTVNSLIPNVATNLQKCATPGFFYTASSDADITSALNAMFNQAVQVAHLSR